MHFELVTVSVRLVIRRAFGLIEGQHQRSLGQLLDANIEFGRSFMFGFFVFRRPRCEHIRIA